MPKIKLLLFSAVAIAIAALFGATEVMAKYACTTGYDTESYAYWDCNGYRVEIGSPFLSYDQVNNETTVTYTIRKTTAVHNPSHFNFLIPRDVASNYKEGSVTCDGSPCSFALQWDGQGDPSMDPERFGENLIWFVTGKVGSWVWPQDDSMTVSLTFIGEYLAYRTDSSIRATNDPGSWAGGPIQGLIPKITGQQFIVTSSASEECKILGYDYDEINKVWVPASMLIKREVDGCTVLSSNVYFFAGDPECKSSIECTPGTPGCKLLYSVTATPYPGQNYCMALDGPECNECVQQEVGSPETQSPQEYWYWNNGQLSYSCFDLAVGFPYQCPPLCYTLAKCP